MQRIYVIPFLVLAILNLILGVFTGLGRMGWNFPLHEAYIHHGSIMVGGFLGTLISVEKIIPTKKRIYLMVPMFSAGSIFMFSFGQFNVGVIFLLIASAGLILVYFWYIRKQYDLPMLLMLAGSVCWLIGNAMLITKHFYPMAFPWWMGFILLTIVSERLELSKFLPVTTQTKNLLLFFLTLFLLGITLPFHGWGTYIAGVTIILISIWLMRHDVIRLNIRKAGLIRYTGIALLGGYVALLLCGIFLIVFPDVPYAYDAIVHTFFLGFAFSMIFAHGPIIFPGVIGISAKPFHPVLYIPLVLLWLSVILRISADANFIWSHWRLTTGWLSAGSILFYFATMGIVMIRNIRNAKAF